MKNFLNPVINLYNFPEAEDIEVEKNQKSEELAETDTELPEKTAEEDDAETDAKGTIEYAQIQAQKIIEDAKCQAEQVAKEYQEKAQAEIEQAKEEARLEGYRQGYQEGLTKAKIEAQTQIEEQMQHESQQIAAFLKEATEEREKLIQQTRGELCDLSIAIAEKVIHVSLKSSKEVIARMIQVVTEKMKRREWVQIYVGGCDAKSLVQITPELTTSLASLSDHIKIIPMTNDESGTCIIEMPDEIIDASVSTQLQNIRQALSEN